MIFLSQILNKQVYSKKQKFGKIIDAAVFENYPNPSLSKIVIKKGRKKITVPPNEIELSEKGAILKSENIPFLPYDDSAFYLNEDLLDKQVIDVDGKRLVRVNDIVLEKNGELKVVGIDIGAAGLLRRLHFEKIIKANPKIIPWQMIEAFDYHTGNIKIKLTESRLNKLHPSELADILEDAGTKERLGIVGILEAGRAARAIEEADDRTQEAILEQLPSPFLKSVVEKMRVSHIADVFYKLNPLRIKEILKMLGKEKAEKVERLVEFSDDTAGGLMDINFYSFNGSLTVKELLSKLTSFNVKPEAIIIINGNEKLVGTLYARNLINADHLAILKDIVSDKKFTYPNVSFSHILEIFANYNLRILPVVDKDKKPIGIVTIDTILSMIEEVKEENESI